MSTVTLFVTSTNFVTTVITTAEDTATSTCHTTVTTTVQSPERRQFTWAMGKLQQAMLPTPSLAANRHPFQRVATTTTQLAIEFNISTATTTELMPSTTTVTLVSVTDVPVTSFVYDGAKTTVTLNSTHTVTTTLPKPPASTTAVFSSIPFPSPEPTPIPPPASPPNPGMPTKTKAAIGAGAAALGSLLAIASIAYRHYRKKQAAKRDTSSSALAVQHYNNYGKFSKTSGHRMDLEGREPTIPNLRPIPGYRGTTRTGVLTKRNIHGPVLVNMAEKAAMTEIAARRRLPMVGPRQSPHTSTQSQQEQSPSPSDHKGKEKALPLWQGGTTPPYAAHLKRLPVTDHTGRFAPGSKEHGRFSAVDWKPVPPRQELGGEKKKPAWELPVEEVDGDAAGREVENDMTSSVYSDAEEIVDGRK
ncbi:hypothetical protein DL546_009210 [Coniochaeta pulveracea]|uniref:Uncharacterized protein n=1 Tax=Coniochaeta pulveracea TaxID=177199 RepID=A0A420YGU3_9PEZI|nr:hypothetical protein DL546_009210 [Coniochaeta pulveracea]